MQVDWGERDTGMCTLREEPNSAQVTGEGSELVLRPCLSGCACSEPDHAQSGAQPITGPEGNAPLRELRQASDALPLTNDQAPVVDVFGALQRDRPYRATQGSGGVCQTQQATSGNRNPLRGMRHPRLRYRDSTCEGRGEILFSALFQIRTDQAADHQELQGLRQGDAAQTESGRRRDLFTCLSRLGEDLAPLGSPAQRTTGETRRQGVRARLGATPPEQVTQGVATRTPTRSRAAIGPLLAER